MTENGRLSVRQTKALAALVAGSTHTAAAAAAGVSDRQLRRWLALPAFAAALQAARDEAFSETLEGLRRVSGKAVAAVEALLGAKVPADTRLTAARTVLGVALKAHDAIALEARLAEIEQTLGLRKATP